MRRLWFLKPLGPHLGRPGCSPRTASDSATTRDLVVRASTHWPAAPGWLRTPQFAAKLPVASACRWPTTEGRGRLPCSRRMRNRQVGRRAVLGQPDRRDGVGCLCSPRRFRWRHRSGPLAFAGSLRPLRQGRRQSSPPPIATVPLSAPIGVGPLPGSEDFW